MSILTLALISVGILNIVFYSRKICKKKDIPPLVLLNIKSILSPDLMLILIFIHLVSKTLNAYCTQLQRSANYSLPFTSTCKVYFIETQSHPFIHTKVELLWLFSHRNTRVALLWQSPYAYKAYNIYHLNLYKKMFTDPFSKGT